MPIEDDSNTDRATTAAEEETLRQVMDVVPRGALALSGLLLFAIIIGWLAIYWLVFVPRGLIG